MDENQWILSEGWPLNVDFQSILTENQWVHFPQWCGESPTTVMWWAKSATCCHLRWQAVTYCQLWWQVVTGTDMCWQVLKCSLCHPTGMDRLNHPFPTAPVLQCWTLRAQHHVYTCNFMCTVQYDKYGGGERKKSSFFPPPYNTANYSLLHGPGTKHWDIVPALCL